MATAQSFGLVLIGMEWISSPALQGWIPLDQGQLQTALFLQLAAGGHMLLFVVRTRTSIFMPLYPSWQLFSAVVVTQIVAVLLCAFGVLVTPLPWAVIGLIWAYVLCWTVLTDLVKLAYYRFGPPSRSTTSSLQAPIAPAV